MKYNHLLIERTLFACLIFFVSITGLLAQKTHSDNGDGTYSNPVIAADFPDPDVILVDNVYYMVTTTMFVFPGAELIVVLRGLEIRGKLVYQVLGRLQLARRDLRRRQLQILRLADRLVGPQRHQLQGSICRAKQPHVLPLAHTQRQMAARPDSLSALTSAANISLSVSGPSR